MDIKIQLEFLDNLDTIVKYQNINLIKELCKYMKWNTDIENDLICKFIKN